MINLFPRAEFYYEIIYKHKFFSALINYVHVCHQYPLVITSYLIKIQNMLESQRKKASFNQLQLSHFIYGGKEKFDQFQKLLSFVANDPIMKFEPSFLHQSRADMMTTFAKKILRFHSKYPLDGSNEIEKVNIFTHATPLSLHGLMFLTTLKNLCDAQQVKQFLQPAVRGQIIGCYAQTQIAHGSDVQNLLTTATYDASSETFIINTPEIGATKWWIGDLGIYCNHAALFAQLIIDGKRHGVHVFLVPIRNKQTLQPLIGIQVGDIGPKHGFQNKDNGYLILRNVRIPRRNMLMKYNVVSKEGKYSLQGDQKISYATMLLTRSGITSMLAHNTARISTIGTRYSIVRTQFKNSNGKEVSVLDYQTQQEKIIPRIAQSYAAIFSSQALESLGNLVFQQSKKKNFGLLNQAHILTSGIKAILSYDTLRGGEIVRRSAGGHGFHVYNGIIPIIIQSTPAFTLQGQFTVLLIQVARFLIKSFSKLVKGKPLGQSVQYLQKISKENQSISNPSLQSLGCPYFVHKILQTHSFERVKHLSTKFAQILGEKLHFQEIENHHVGILMNDAAIAHVYATIYSLTLQKIQTLKNPQIKKVLTKLLILYGIEKIVQRSAKFYETSTLTPEAFTLIYQKRSSLLEQLRPECLGLVEAFGFDDCILMSAIGGSNGKPYETLIEWAEKYNTMNRKYQRDQVVNAIKQAKSLLKPRL